MTTIKKKYTKTEKYTETVKTCDICGLSEEDLPDEESINEVKGAPEVSKTYAVIYFDAGNQDSRVEETFDAYQEANQKLQEKIDEGSVYKSYTTVSVEYDFEMDACTHCINTLLSGAL